MQKKWTDNEINLLRRLFNKGLSDEEISLKFEQTINAIRVKRCKLGIKNTGKKILITHMHPSGSKAEFTGFPGSLSIRKAIEKFQPDIAIFSHIHEASGMEEKIGKTLVINVSRKERIFEV